MVIDFKTKGSAANALRLLARVEDFVKVRLFDNLQFRGKIIKNAWKIIFFLPGYIGNVRKEKLQ
jgi:hypothetical protein